MKLILLILLFTISKISANQQSELVVRIINNAKDPNRDPYTLINVPQNNEVGFSGCEDITATCVDQFLKDESELAQISQVQNENKVVTEKKEKIAGCSITANNSNYSMLYFILVVFLLKIIKK